MASLAVFLCFWLCAGGSAVCSRGARFAYVGLYNTSTDPVTFDSAGYAEPSVLVFAIDELTGAFTPRGAVAAGLNTSWIAAHPNGRFVYIVSEVSLYKGEAVGSVASFAVDVDTGALSFLNRVALNTSAPVFAEVDPSGQHLLVATYLPGALEVVKIQPDGRLQEGPSAQVIAQGMGTHCARFDRTGTHVLSTVLGKDKVDQYVWSGASSPSLHSNPAGSSISLAEGTGPRHILFHPLREDRVYIIDEGGAATPARLTVFKYSKDGTLSVLQTVSTIAAGVDQTDMFPAEIAISKDGRFAYVSNRDASSQRRDSVALFALDADSGEASLLESTSTNGWYPRSMALDWSKRTLLVANQKSNNVVSFRVDAETGRLTSTGKSTGALPDAAAFVGFIGSAMDADTEDCTLNV